jgi:hypothetical protein
MTADPHLRAALVLAASVLLYFGYLYWRYLTGVAGDD